MINAKKLVQLVGQKFESSEFWGLNNSFLEELKALPDYKYFLPKTVVLGRYGYSHQKKVSENVVISFFEEMGTQYQKISNFEIFVV